MKKRILSLILALTLLLGALALAEGFSSDPDAIETAAMSVLLLEVYDEDDYLIATGSGFVAYTDQILVTNYHVIEGGSYMLGITDDDRTFKIPYVGTGDKGKDIAICVFEKPTGLTPLTMNTDEKLKRAQTIVAIGSPKGVKNVVSIGNISALYDYDESEAFQFTAPISPGSSGGAIFDNQGRVIGISSATFAESDAQNINIAIRTSEVQTLYDNWNGSIQDMPDFLSGAPAPQQPGIRESVGDLIQLICTDADTFLSSVDGSVTTDEEGTHIDAADGTIYADLTDGIVDLIIVDSDCPYTLCGLRAGLTKDEFVSAMYDFGFEDSEIIDERGTDSNRIYVYDDEYYLIAFPSDGDPDTLDVLALFYSPKITDKSPAASGRTELSTCLCQEPDVFLSAMPEGSKKQDDDTYEYWFYAPDYSVTGFSDNGIVDWIYLSQDNGSDSLSMDYSLWGVTLDMTKNECREALLAYGIADSNIEVEDQRVVGRNGDFMLSANYDESGSMTSVSLGYYAMTQSDNGAAPSGLTEMSIWLGTPSGSFLSAMPEGSQRQNDDTYEYWFHSGDYSVSAYSDNGIVNFICLSNEKGSDASASGYTLWNVTIGMSMADCVTTLEQYGIPDSDIMAEDDTLYGFSGDYVIAVNFDENSGKMKTISMGYYPEESGNIELGGYLGSTLEDFAGAIGGDVIEGSASLFAADDDRTIYASADDVTGLIDYISLYNGNTGYCLHGVAIGMTREQVETVTGGLSLTSYVSEDDEKTTYYWNDTDPYFLAVEYDDNIAVDIGCLVSSNAENAGVIELSGYLDGDLDAFAAAINGEVRSGEGGLYAVNADYSVYAALSDETGRIYYMSIFNGNTGHSIYGLTIGMTREQAESVTSRMGLTGEPDDDDPNRIYYSDATHFVVVIYENELANDISCIYVD